VAEKKSRRVHGETLVRVELFASIAVLGGLCVEKKFCPAFTQSTQRKKSRRVRGEILVRVELFASMAVLGGLCEKKERRVSRRVHREKITQSSRRDFGEGGILCDHCGS
jgi:hypothetical protein